MSTIESGTRNRILEATWRLLEARRDRAVGMQDIAEAAGLSRQAVYLHFGSRAELMIATARYGDQVLGLDERKRRFEAATNGVEMLETYVEFWGSYIPEIYGVARTLLEARETDKAAAATWADRMGAVRESCRAIVEALDSEERLAPPWSLDEATDLLWTMLSIRIWESLTIDCGWSTSQYVDRLQALVRRTFVREPDEAT